MMKLAELNTLLERLRRERQDYVREWTEARSQLATVIPEKERELLHQQIAGLDRSILALDYDIASLLDKIEAEEKGLL